MLSSCSRRTRGVRAAYRLSQALSPSSSSAAQPQSAPGPRSDHARASSSSAQLANPTWSQTFRSPPLPSHSIFLHLTGESAVESESPTLVELRVRSGIQGASVTRLKAVLGVEEEDLLRIVQAAADPRCGAGELLQVAECAKVEPWEALKYVAEHVNNHKRFLHLKERLFMPCIDVATGPRAGRLLLVLVGLKARDQQIAGSDPQVSFTWEELNLAIEKHVAQDTPLALTARASAALAEVAPIRKKEDFGRQRKSHLLAVARDALEREIQDHPGRQSARALWMLGNLYAEGRAQAKKGKAGKRAYEYWKKAAEFGHAPSITRLVYEMSALTSPAPGKPRLLNYAPLQALTYAEMIVLTKPWGGALAANFYYKDDVTPPEVHERRWGVPPDDFKAATRFAWSARLGNWRGKIAWARMILFGRADLDAGLEWMDEYEKLMRERRKEIQESRDSFEEDDDLEAEDVDVDVPDAEPAEPADRRAQMASFKRFDNDGRTICEPPDRPSTRLEKIQAAMRLLDGKAIQDDARLQHIGVYRLAQRLLEEAERGEAAMPTAQDAALDRFRVRNTKIETPVVVVGENPTFLPQAGE
ncbi:hypothetical protein CALVIDRAFT_538535 [Calocera viscosa TUFC12733]|uniref:HCP-like protein n=1 Tax=Calocera viscosa (strain TUFC12733) TaxID=1330018 RepID=A0A167KW17_CALVF|nr:hypothetical protein CALVIDRAFT_538535 [Calocera viscosa TUFC12733]